MKEKKWQCPHCLLINKYDDFCRMCGLYKKNVEDYIEGLSDNSKRKKKTGLYKDHFKYKSQPFSK